MEEEHQSPKRGGGGWWRRRGERGTGEKNGREDEEISKESGMVSFGERVEKL